MARLGLQALRERYDAMLLDLDGTLLDARGKLSPRTHAAVAAVAEAGLLPVICTGRSLAGTKPIHRALGMTHPFVAYNGHYIGDGRTNPWQALTIPDERVPAIAELEQASSFWFRHAEERKVTLLSDHPEHLRIAAWYENVTLLQTPHGMPGEGLMRVSCFFEGAPAAEQAWASVPSDGLHREVFPLSLFSDYPDSNLVLCEVQTESRGKAEAFRWLEAEHGIPASRTIAVGDHMNDRTMLEGAGLAVCPENAAHAVRHLAHMFIGHHAHDGFASWIEQGAPTTPRADA